MFQTRPHSLQPEKLTCHVAFVTKNFGKMGLSNVGLGTMNNGIVKVLRREGYFAESWSAQSAGELHRLIHNSLVESHRSNHPTLSHVVITSPSWASIWEIAELCTKFQNIHFTLVNHTGTAYLQMDANEHHSGVATNKYAAELELERHNFTLAANNVRFCHMIERMLKSPCKHLPNLYDTDGFVERNMPRTPHDTIRIGGFGAPRPWKNQLTSAQSAIMIARELGKKLEFYHNHGDWADEQLQRSRRDLFDNERDLKLIEIPWESWATFRRTIMTMDLLMQPSFDETFNIVTADGIAAGVPSVVSGCIEWAPARWQAEAHDPNDCCRVGIGLLHDPHCIADGRRTLKKYVADALEVWKTYFGR